MKEKALSILNKSVTAVFALSLLILFSLIILVPLPDAVFTALGWIILISGIGTIILAAIKIRS